MTAELEAHLRECLGCAAWEEDLRRIRAVIQAGVPAAVCRPLGLNAGRILLQAGRSLAEEAALIRTLRRVVAAAALLTISSGLLASFSGRWGNAAGEVSIRVVAGSPSGSWFEQIVDEDNSIILMLGGP